MDEKKFVLEIITPELTVFKGEVKYVEAPSLVGSLGILPGHTPLLAELKSGTVRVKQPQKENSYNVSEGFIEILPDKVRILVEECKSC